MMRQSCSLPNLASSIASIKAGSLDILLSKADGALAGSKSPGSLRLQEAIAFYSNLRGLYAAVAKDMGVSQTHVKEVAIGNRQSRKVTEAIEREYERIVRDGSAK